MADSQAHQVAQGAILLDQYAQGWRQYVQPSWLATGQPILHYLFTPNVQHKPSYDFFKSLTELTDTQMAEHGFYREPIPPEMQLLWIEELAK